MIERTLSMIALAALPALDAPRALMMAAPRCCTVERKSPWSQDKSWMTSVAGLPLIFALRKSGYWVAEWLPQMAALVTAVTGTAAFVASRRFGRFSSSRVIAIH